MERARAAVGEGGWNQAYDLLVRADASTPLAGPDLVLLADVAYEAGHLDETITAWERAHAQSVSAGDNLSAARAAVRVAMHLLFDTALMAPVRGWIRRAEQLLTGHDDTPVHAWLAVVRSYERLLSGDFRNARQWAERAVEVGTRCDAAAAALGRVAAARGLILEGKVSDGLGLLDEAAVAAVSGELDPLSTGVVYCEVVCALQALAQYDAAEEWTAAMEQWHPGKPVGSIHGRCRVHRAEILRLRGSYLEAEKEALAACEELRPYLRREFGWPLTELGRIRLRRGDIPGAEEAFLAAHALGWDPQPGLALVHLARGDIARAAESIRDALEHPLSIPSKELPPNTELRQAPLLEAQVEIGVVAGQLAVGRAAADELARIAAQFESKALAASAALAHGRVELAAGETAGARRAFAEAAHLWNEVGAPYETALARMGLAQAYRAEGWEERALLEFQAARAGFERVGAVHQAAAAQAWGRVGETGAPGPVPQPSLTGSRRATGARAQENVFRREGDYWAVTFEGQTVRLRDLKGMRYLASLLTYPGREFHVLDLVAGESGRPAERREHSGLTVSSDSDAGVLLDAQAKEAYRRRLAEIAEDIEEARAMGDDERAAQAEVERDFLVRELARAVGLGGRDRRVGSASERARASVTRAIRQAMARIREYHPVLGKHLEQAIRTGTYCVYLPDPRVPPTWQR
ncbi:MAG: transcriptional regulator [Chloroflexi bacterium]|nr:transcriptional regulator [Chloroflexota bacterium]